MQIVNVHAAKTHFSHLLEQVEAGEEVVVARAGKPVARLVAFGQPRGGRVLGVLGGTLRIPADFDAALPDEVLAAFEGGWLRLLLDTHYLLWALDRPEVMPAAARRAIEDQANDVLFSAASVWELAIKAALGRADFQVDPGKVAEAARETGFRELAVTAEHACVVAGLPMHHRDPFDRLLVAQALALPARLLTADAALQPYSELVWLAPSGS